jgi:hypothetical protein
VWHETHIYYAFTDDFNNMNIEQLANHVRKADSIRNIGFQRTFVGEWSAGMRGQRSPSDQGIFMKAQLDAYSRSNWAFWTWYILLTIGRRYQIMVVGP